MDKPKAQMFPEAADLIRRAQEDMAQQKDRKMLEDIELDNEVRMMLEIV